MTLLDAARRLDAVLDRARSGTGEGLRALPSFCTAEPRTLSAILAVAAARDLPVLVEATSNQVNPDGGYTGMRPADFRRRLEALAADAGSPALLLGGDHLGPNPYRHLPAPEAMTRAERMVAEYAAAGFVKLHLDASMPLNGEPPPAPALVAERAARLAAAAEAAAPEPEALRYVIGTEVPPPGGETAEGAIAVTTPDSVAETVETHRAAFAAAGQEAAFARVRALVVQPGVDFAVESVHRFDPAAAHALTEALDGTPFVYEAHSTDFQPTESLRALVHAGFAILKVGPEATFAFREAVQALDAIEATLRPPADRADAIGTALAAMDRNPARWRPYATGTPGEVERRKLYGYSDRIRYVWADPEVATRVDRLVAALPAGALPAPVVSQHAPWCRGDPLASAQTVVARRVAEVALRYFDAAAG